MSVQIVAVHMSSPSGYLHEHIAEVQWVDHGDNTTDKSSVATMVDWIDNKKGQAYTDDGQTRATVGTVHPDRGAAFIRTHADGKGTDNLLALPRY